MFQGRTILVTDGTGSIGHDFLKPVLTRNHPARVIVFSRDEMQHDMWPADQVHLLAFVIGDVRDRHHVAQAMWGDHSGRRNRNRCYRLAGHRL